LTLEPEDQKGEDDAATSSTAEDLSKPPVKTRKPRGPNKRPRPVSSEPPSEDHDEGAGSEDEAGGSASTPTQPKRRRAAANPPSAGAAAVRESSPAKSVPEKQKPGRKSLEELREKFTGKLLEVWKVARELKMGNRVISEPFISLPSEKDFPDYYTTIERPMDMTIIRGKIEGAKVGIDE
jgi:hypothetical protein